MAKWIQKAKEKMVKKGTVGVFSAAAKKAKMGTKTYAKKVLASKKSSPLQKKRANFAINAGKRGR